VHNATLLGEKQNFAVTWPMSAGPDSYHDVNRRGSGGVIGRASVGCDAHRALSLAGQAT
jgi:hypothetical protein